MCHCTMKHFLKFYRCAVPECEKIDEASFEGPTWIKMSQPSDNQKCLRYEVIRDKNTKECTKVSFTNKTIECTDWIYDPGEVTILNEV